MKLATAFAALTMALSAQAWAQQEQEQQAAQPAAITADDFIKQAIQDNTADVEAARLAQSAANAAQPVQALGQAISRDATVFNSQLAQLASQRNVPMTSQPAQEDRQTLDNLAKAQGPDFSRQYLDFLVADLKQDIQLYQQAAQTVQDPAVKQYAQQAIPILQRHLATAQQVQQQQASGATQPGQMPQRPPGALD